MRKMREKKKILEQTNWKRKQKEVNKQTIPQKAHDCILLLIFSFRFQTISYVFFLSTATRKQTSFGSSVRMAGSQERKGES
jgi:hypothetical protein